MPLFFGEFISVLYFFHQDRIVAMGRAEFGRKDPAVTLIGSAVLVADIFEPADWG